MKTLVPGPVDCHRYVCTEVENLVKAYKISTDILLGMHFSLGQGVQVLLIFFISAFIVVALFTFLGYFILKKRRARMGVVLNDADIPHQHLGDLGDPEAPPPPASEAGALDRMSPVGQFLLIIVKQISYLPFFLLFQLGEEMHNIDLNEFGVENENYATA